MNSPFWTCKCTAQGFAVAALHRAALHRGLCDCGTKRKGMHPLRHPTGHAQALPVCPAATTFPAAGLATRMPFPTTLAAPCASPTPPTAPSKFPAPLAAPSKRLSKEPAGAKAPQLRACLTISAATAPPTPPQSSWLMTSAATAFLPHLPRSCSPINLPCELLTNKPAL